MILYGHDVASGRKVAFPFSYHAGKMTQVCGETGGGKSLLVARIVLQYLEMGVTNRNELCPIVVVDLGGDLFLANLLMDRCRQLGRTFKWLSLDPGDVTHYFDPLQGCEALRGSAGRKANFVTAGMNLAYQEGFGSGYFGRLNLATIREAFSQLARGGVESPSLVELGEELSRMAKRQRGGKEAAEALYAVDQLLDYRALRPTEDPTQRIDIDQALEECQVLYFFLGTLQEPLAARATAALAAWSIINTAAHRRKTGKPLRTVPLVIDEAAQLIHGPSFQDALVLSRKLGVRITSIYQSEAQLRSARGTDMSQVLRDNCAIKAFFTTDVGDKRAVDGLLGYSKLEKVPRRGVSLSGLRATTSQQEHEEPTLKVNDVLDVNSTFGEYFLVFKDGRGHSEPLRVMSDFPTTKAEHEALSERPLPRRENEVPNSQSPTSPTTKVKPSKPNEAPTKRQALLRNLRTRLEAEERWKLTSH